MKTTRQTIFFLIFLITLATVVACQSIQDAVNPPTPTAIPTRVPTATTAPPAPTPTRTKSPILPAILFAASMAVPIDNATAANREAARVEIKRLKALGINSVIQLFAPQTTLYDWQTFLDVAAQEEIAIIAGFADAPPVWNGTQFDLGMNEAFLKALQKHPALYAYLIVDDPFGPKYGNVITTERLQLLYRQVKSVAPNTRVIVQFGRTISKAELERNPRSAFKTGMCDICVIGATEFRNLGDGNKFRRDDLILNHTLARAVIKRENPKAQIWTMLQTFGAVARSGNAESSTYYMPSADELRQLLDTLGLLDTQTKVKSDGYVWQQWAPDLQARDAALNTLWDSDFGAQRDRVKQMAKQLGLPVPP